MARVQPRALFDPAVEGPPADAIDVQLRLPRSLQLWCADQAAAANWDALGSLQDLVEHTVHHELVPYAQRMCGEVRPPSSRRTATDEPAQIAVTAVVEGTLPGSTELRPHAHLYIGATGWRLSDGADLPTSFDAVRIGAGVAVWQSFSRSVKGWTDAREMVWSFSSPSGRLELVDPPLADRAEEAGYVVCPGRWGPRRLILADERVIAGAAASEERRVAQEAAGIGQEGPPMPIDEQVRLGVSAYFADPAAWGQALGAASGEAPSG